MNNTHIKRRWLGVVIAVSVVAAVMAGCSSLEYERTNPDGSKERLGIRQLDPNLEVKPGQFKITPHGHTDEGWPIEQMVPNSGKGPIIYKVVPPGYLPIYFQPNQSSTPTAKPTTTQTETNREASVVKSVPRFDTYHALCNLDADYGMLEIRTGDGPWVLLAQGSIDSVLRVGIANGIHPMEFENEFGAWKVTVDKKYPLVCTRFNGVIVNVRGLR